MIVGMGIDIVELARIEKSLGRFGLRFAEKILGPEELAGMPGHPLNYVAGRFAAKEAAVKALGLPPGLRPLQQTRYRGHMVWVLWDVDYMQREDQRYASMLAFLRQSLRQVAR